MLKLTCRHSNCTFDRIEYRHPDQVIHLSAITGDPIFPVTRYVSDLSCFIFGPHREAVISAWNRPFDAVKTLDGAQLADRYILPNLSWMPS
jgi:hypothetical protein